MDQQDFIVDFQGFRKGKNRFVLKELAIIPLQNEKIQNFPCYLFEPPCAWNALMDQEMKVNTYLERHYHGIPWNSGFLPFDLWPDVLREKLANARRIYLKGLEKFKFLKEILPSAYVCDLEMLRCPSLKDLPEDGDVSCYYHHYDTNRACALRNVKKLKRWMEQRWIVVDDDGCDVVDVNDDDDDESFVREEDQEKIDLAEFRSDDVYKF